MAVSTAVAVGDGHGQPAQPRLVVVYVEAKTSSSAQAEVELQDFVREVAANSGRPEVQLFKEIGRPNRLAVVERWANLDSGALDRQVETLSGRLRGALQAPIDARLASDLTPPAARASKTAAFDVLMHIDVVPEGAASAAEILRQQRTAVLDATGGVVFEAGTQVDRPNHFTVHEAWTNRRAYEAYTEGAAARALRTRLATVKGALFDDRYYAEVPTGGA